MTDRHLGSDQGGGSRTCPVCQGADLFDLSVRRTPPLLRCRSCRLIFRRDPVHAVVDERMNRERLGRLGEGRHPIYTSTLEKLGVHRRLGTLLDIGCGNGYFARLAHQSGWRVAAFDSSEYLCRQARGFGTGMVVRAYAQSVPFSERQFDVVTLWDVIDHLEHPIPALTEALRVLRPGGLLYLRVRNGPIHVGLRRLLLVPKAASVMHTQMFSGSSLATALNVAGFTEIRTDVSSLTTGNPYASPAQQGAGALKAFKNLWSAGAKLTSRLTHRHLLLAPSIQALARRPLE